MSHLDTLADFGPLASMEAEQSVIGAAMLDGRQVDRLADVISLADFAAPAHRSIWKAMQALHARNRPLDLVTVSEALEDSGHLAEIGGLGYLAEVAQNTPSAANARAYAEIVADLGARRRLLDELGNIAGHARDKQASLPELVDAAQDRLARLIRDDASEAGPIGEELNALVDELDRKWNGDLDPMGAPFGLADLDRATMGMHPAQMILVAGRPSMGKTAKALNMLRATCINGGRPAIMYSMEMDRQSLLKRLAASQADIPLNALRDPKGHMSDEYWARLAPAAKAIKDAPLIVDDRAAMTPSQVRASAKRWRDRFGDMGLVVVDYLQLMGSDRRHGNREQEVAEASRSMKLLAKELKCPVVVLSQLNRSLEQRPNKRPIMSDLRESGSLEQDADLILFLYREEVYNPDTDRQGIAEIIIGKQREGELGTILAAARLAHGRFDDLSPDYLARLAQQADEAPARPVSAEDFL